MAKGKRPAPFRTRKLSLSAPMVLHGRLCGRVGRRRTYFETRPIHDRGWASSHFWAPWRSARRCGWAVDRVVALTPRLPAVAGSPGLPVRRCAAGPGRPPGRRRMRPAADSSRGPRPGCSAAALSRPARAEPLRRSTRRGDPWAGPCSCATSSGRGGSRALTHWSMGLRTSASSGVGAGQTGPGVRGRTSSGPVVPREGSCRALVRVGSRRADVELYPPRRRRRRSQSPAGATTDAQGTGLARSPGAGPV